MLRIALTCDDAPTIAADGPRVPADPSRMDVLRETLQRTGVEHCVAFVIGAHVKDPGPLQRWLGAGFELGNHTWEHAPASGLDARAFEDSVRRCDEVLENVGAFDGDRIRWFRFPYLDYGRDDSHRAALTGVLAQRGHRVAHATVDLYDDRFEHALGAADLSAQAWRQRVIGQRYERTALRSLRAAVRSFGDRGVPQVPYFHFGPTSTRFLPGVLSQLKREGVQYVSLDDALSHPALQRERGTGLVLAHGTASLAKRLGRRLQREVNRWEPTSGKLLGPPWPRVRR